MTTPEDVAQALVILADPRLNWCSGAIISLEGGKRIVGIG